MSIVRTGDRLGRFTLGELIGHGGMAMVFRSRDPQLDRDVAIKVLSPVMALKKDGAERFRREALAVAAIRHRGIVEVHDFVPAGDDHGAYLVEEMIEGPTLQDILDREKQAVLPEAAALLVADVAEALQAGHDKGVIHRDVKPANIMLEDREGGARVVVTDFGIAHIGALATMTATGAVMGSPAYMSPEQARGLDVGPACDVWSLGVLLYQLCTGHLPFAARDPVSAIAAISSGSFRRAAQLAPRVSPALDRIIARCLSLDQTQRPESAGDLARTLRAEASDAGVADGATVIKQLLQGAALLDASFGDRVVAHALRQARAGIKAGQLARAVAELGRASAHQPNNAEVEKLLASISARRRVGKIALLSGGALAVIAVFLFVPRFLSGPESTVGSVPENTTSKNATSENTTSENTTTSAGLREPTVPVRVPATPVPIDQRLALRARETAEVPAPRRRTASAPTPTNSAGAAAFVTRDDGEVSNAATDAVKDAPAAALLAPPAPPESSIPPKTAGQVRLLAQRAFCYPALDDGELRATPAVYRNVTPGRHQVFCARNRGGPREPVGELDVPAGASIERNIVPASDGKPKFSTFSSFSPSSSPPR